MAFDGADNHAVFNEEEDLDDDDDYEEALDPPPNVIDDEDDDVDDDDSTSSSNIRPTVPVHPPSMALPPLTTSNPAPCDVTIAVAGLPSDPFRPDLKRQQIDDVTTVASAAIGEKKPSAAFDESRKLFQRLWTDEDEIELLQGFLEYTAQRGGTNSSHHHDTTAFYDQIKSKLQLDFNKNQLVEKLRRLKKKYRNVLSKIVTGKEYVFKSPHDQATFEISRKIWNNVAGSPAVRGGSIGSTAAAENGGYDDDEAIPNQIPNFLDHNATPNGIDTKTPRSRKRSRVGTPKIEEKQLFSQPLYQPSGFTTVVTPSSTSIPNPIPTPIPNSNASTAALMPPFKAVTLMPPTTTTAPPKGGPSTCIPTMIEETVKSCLSPIFKELMNNSMNMNTNGPRGLGLSAALGPMPLGLGSEALSPEMMADKKWRRQQILELEVYSRRLELVQDQIKEQLEHLKSMGS